MVGLRVKKLVILAVPLVMAGCGGGGSETSVSANTVATVIVEERLGKTVFDAWFERSSANAFDVATQAQQGLDACKFDPKTSRRGTPNLVREDTRIDLVNQAGPFVSLVPNQLAGNTVYTTDARWLSTPVSADASLVFNSSSSSPFQSMGVVSLPRLAPLNWIAPTNGVLDSVSDTLQWDASLNANTTVRINLSVTHANSESTVVVCDVADDGQFQLDAATQQRLNVAGGSVVIRAQRVRTQTYQSGDAQLSVVQISHERSI